MAIKYYFTYICLVLFLITGCASGGRIELSEVSTRSQLDSIIKLLPEDSVFVDSLPKRVLRISLDGRFSMYGVPVDDVVFTLKNEELWVLRVASQSHFKQILGNIEKESGTGLYASSGGFSWDLPEKAIDLSSYAEWETLLDINDTHSFSLNCNYYPAINTNALEISKRLPESIPQYYITVKFQNYYTDDFKLTLNGILIGDGETPINNMLIDGEQKLLFTPVGNKEYYDYSGYNIVVSVFSRDKSGIKKVLQNYSLTSAQQKLFTFSIDSVTPMPAHIVDLRTDETLKDKLYAEYEKLYNAFKAKDEDAVVKYLEPYLKAKMILNGNSKTWLHKEWEVYSSLINSPKKIRLIDKGLTELTFSDDGTLASLSPTVNRPVLVVEAMILGEEEFNFYFYQDKDGNLKIYY